MPFIVYFLILLVAAGSVLFGLDWMSVPLPSRPNPPATHALLPPPARVSVPIGTRMLVAADAEDKAKDAALLSPVYPANPTPVENDTAATAASTAGSASSAPLCDVDACADAYHSFRASDCTYQPYGRPRQLCKKGHLPALARDATADSPRQSLATDARAQASCNVSACARAYSTFDASDCTYQPYEGPRQACTK